MAAVKGIKDFLTVNNKQRNDGFTDQFSRVFMVKVLITFSFLLSFNWFIDNITCVIPDTSKIRNEFVTQSCWIQGLYVYKDIPTDGVTFSYYGIPPDLQKDGIRYGRGEMCKSNKKKENVNL